MLLFGRSLCTDDYVVPNDSKAVYKAVREATSATRHQPHCSRTNTQWLLAGVGQYSLVEAEEVERLKQVFPLLSVQSDVRADIKPWVEEHRGLIMSVALSLPSLPLVYSLLASPLTSLEFLHDYGPIGIGDVESGVLWRVGWGDDGH